MKSLRTPNWHGVNKTRVNLRYNRINKALQPGRRRPLASHRFMNNGLIRFAENWWK
jgi:hypothetical protein